MSTVELPSGSVRVTVVPVDHGEYAVAAAPLRPVLDSMEGLLNATLLAGAIGIALTSVGAWLAARRGLRPLESITALANEVAPDALGLRTGLDNGDEIGAVAAAIDRMLHRLETAFEAQKHFLEDASHELARRSRSRAATSNYSPTSPTPAARSATPRWAWRSTRSIAWDGWWTGCSTGRASEVERLNVGALPVEPLLDSIASQLRRLGGREWAIDAPAGLRVMADEDVLRQIVLNVARNADEHSPPEAPVEISARPAGRSVVITVADRGSGIDPQVRGHVFDRFAHDGQGVGLGLAISKALVEAQNGSIALDDRAGGGVEAVIRLPTG